MKLRFIWVGKTKRSSLRALVDDYLERLGRFGRVEVVEIRDRDEEGGLEKEGIDILSRVKDDPLMIVLDEQGREMDSPELAALLEKNRTIGTRQITFVLGGPNGLSKSVKKRADLLVSLSRMTLTHEFARVLLVEQLYRGFTILLNLPYQK
jgi:23S rRNA (pseudouridine1915-N3)-methyltransferase